MRDVRMQVFLVVLFLAAALASAALSGLGAWP